MGENIAPGLRELLRERKISRSKTSRGMVEKELAASRADSIAARKSLREGDSKWATVQGYYSMFHSARALLYHKGFREKSHRGLLAALRLLYSRELTSSILEDYGEAMNLRESADYGLVWSDESASSVLDTAEAFRSKAESLLRTGRKSMFGSSPRLRSFTAKDEAESHEL